MKSWTRLEPAQIANLADKLADTYFDENEVWRDVAKGTNEDIYRRYIPQQAGPMLPSLEKVIVGLQKDGTLPYFLMQTIKTKPGRSDLPVYFSELFPEIDFGALGIKTPFGETIPNIPLIAQEKGESKAGTFSLYSPGLQKNVRPGNPDLNPFSWTNKLGRLLKNTCRVEIGGQGIGTGFLVGPQCILTNYHVIEPYQSNLSNVTCRFDYHVKSDGQINMSDPVGLGNRYVLASSPYHPDENTRDAENSSPALDQLDYALLHLERPIGFELSNGVERSWIDISQPVQLMQEGDGVIILQHPHYGRGQDSEPLKMAIDTDAFINHDVGTRYRYHTNTEPGSSGSPCFNMSLDIFALHRLGDPGWRGDEQGDPQYNQGVPIDLIHQSILQSNRDWLTSEIGDGPA